MDDGQMGTENCATTLLPTHARSAPLVAGVLLPALVAASCAAADGRLTLAGLPEGDLELRIGLETERPTIYRKRLVSELSATVNIATLGGAHVLSGECCSPTVRRVQERSPTRG